SHAGMSTTGKRWKCAQSGTGKLTLIFLPTSLPGWDFYTIRRSWAVRIIFMAPPSIARYAGSAIPISFTERRLMIAPTKKRKNWVGLRHRLQNQSWWTASPKPVGKARLFQAKKQLRKCVRLYAMREEKWAVSRGCTMIG